MRRPIGFAAASLVLLLLIFTAQPAFGAVRDYDIWLKPLTPDGGTLKPHLVYGRSCDINRNPHDGCMLFEVDSIGAITFSVRTIGNNKQDSLTCPDKPSDGSYKVITGIEVTATPDQKDRWIKGDFSGGIDGTWLKMFAFPQADSEGYIYKAVDKKQGLSEVTVVNMNAHPESPDIKSFWYRVTVEDCVSEAKWITDPRGDNQGRR